MTRRYSRAEVAREIGKTENWVQRNARYYPHTRAGRTITWDDVDLQALKDALRVRPGRDMSDEFRPLPAGRRRAS